LPKEVQNLLILVYADQTNRSFLRYGSNYTPSLDNMPDELELKQETLPDLKDWSEAVTRVADIFGHAISKLLNASNLATLAAKLKESVTEYKADCDILPDRLQFVMKNLGVPEAEFVNCDRVRTAKAVKTLLADCDNKEPTSLVDAIAHATLVTNSTTTGKSLKSAKALLDCLRTTRWALFSAVAQIRDEGKPDADTLIQDLVKWLKADEHALAGGLANKLSDAEDRAIKLLTPSKPVDNNPQQQVEPVKPKPGWKYIEAGTKTRLGHTESISETQGLLQRLEGNPKLRLTVQWTLEEESP
jgi:predicted nucleotidyltransferase